MSLVALCHWLQDTAISTAVRESTWGYPIIAAIHVLGVAWFGGSILVMDLRLLGAIMRSEPVVQVADGLRAFQRAGLGFMLSSGALLFASQAVRYYGSASFRIKMALIVLAGMNALASRRAKLSGALSLFFWIGIIFASRGIAFF